MVAPEEVGEDGVRWPLVEDTTGEVSPQFRFDG